MNKPGQKIAMISSTSIDLPEHRRMVMDACLRMGFRPIMMDHLAGQDRSASEVSIGMVKDADVYLGIFAHAYGSNPDNDDRSYTEIEFDEAVKLGIAVIPFFINDDHPWPPRLVDKGAKAEKLERLKKKVQKDRLVQWFGSPEDLRGLVIHALGEFEKQRATREDTTKVLDFHPPNIIPKSPEPYIAHPYSLLQTKDVVGRQAELNLLTDWVTANQQVPADTRIFNLVAIGGMGKSALTWKWFNDIAPNELPKLAGRIWWSFYESDAHWDNFIIRALAYVSGLSEKEVREMESPEREDQLWQILDQKPFLLVLDGLERILLAYARMDAAQMLDDDLDEETAHEERMFAGIPENIRETYLQKHRLRQCIDANAARFLRRLTKIRASRILITTRLYPAELQTNTAQPWPACFAVFLKGLHDDDALNLWREFGVSGSRDQLLKLFNTFGNYPLLIRALAGEIAEYRLAPGYFDQWMADNPNFNPGDLDLKNAKTHVLQYALRGLPEEHRKVLRTIAAFRMPATWDTLCALLVGRGKPIVEVRQLDMALTELEDRGLVGWHKEANRYDLHPVTRSIVWQSLSESARHEIFEELHRYFETVPRVDWKDVRRLEDLEPYFHLSQSLIGLGRAEEAEQLLQEQVRRLISEPPDRRTE